MSLESAFTHPPGQTCRGSCRTLRRCGARVVDQFTARSNVWRSDPDTCLIWRADLELPARNDNGSRALVPLHSLSLFVLSAVLLDCYPPQLLLDVSVWQITARPFTDEANSANRNLANLADRLCLKQAAAASSFSSSHQVGEFSLHSMLKEAESLSSQLHLWGDGNPIEPKSGPEPKSRTGAKGHKEQPSFRTRGTNKDSQSAQVSVSESGQSIGKFDSINEAICTDALRRLTSREARESRRSG